MSKNGTSTGSTAGTHFGGCIPRHEKHTPTLRSTVDSGMSNSPIMQRGMAPPHGFALSIFLSNRTVSMLFSWAKISAAQAPEGPPPTTATLYLMSSDVALDEEVAAAAVMWETPPPLMKEEGVKAAVVPTRRGAMASFMLEIEGGETGGEEKWILGVLKMRARKVRWLWLMRLQPKVHPFQARSAKEQKHKRRR